MNTYCTPITDWLTHVGVNDRLKVLFENQWPLPKGVAYNAYLAKDEKTALLDSVDAHQADDFMTKVRTALGDCTLDYYVIHHVEPDHSSTIPLVRRYYPDVTLVGNKKTFTLLNQFYDIDEENAIIVGEGDSLSLGKHKLTFHMTPMTHWPESMVSYEETDGILFSQDIFGGFGALDGKIFDDEIGDIESVYAEACRYYTNIVGKYSHMAAKALKKVEGLTINMICPVHGPIWRTHPEHIVSLYSNLANCRSQNGVVIAFGSMYGNTEHMADMLARFLSEAGVKNIHLFDVTKTHPSIISTEIWKYRGFITCAPTYNNALFLPMRNLLDILSENKMQNKTMGIVGNYSWSGGAVKEMQAWLEKQPFEFVEPVVEAKSAAKEEELNQLRALAQAMADNLASHADTDDVHYYSHIGE